MDRVKFVKPINSDDEIKKLIINLRASPSETYMEKVKFILKN